MDPNTVSLCTCLRFQGYNALQIGEVMMWFGIPQLFVMVFVPWLTEKVDGRFLIFVGLFAILVGLCHECIHRLRVSLVRNW